MGTSRIEVLARRPKRTLVALAVALAAIGVAVGSGATFTAQSANPGNAFTAGTLTMDNSNDAAAILTASNLRPGDVTTGTVDIENTGSLSGTFTLSRSAIVNSDLANPMDTQMDMLIEDCGLFVLAVPPVCTPVATDVYSGTLAAMTGSYTLGSLAPADRHRYRFQATFNAGAGNQYQGDSTTATFQWDAS